LAGLLKHLQYVLKEIDRIWDQPTFLLPGHGGAKLNGSSWELTLRFIGISLAVTPFNPNVAESIWDTTEENLKAVRELLNLSPLFGENPAEDYEVDAAMSSLERIFMSLDTEAEASAWSELNQAMVPFTFRFRSHQRNGRRKKGTQMRKNPGQNLSRRQTRSRRSSQIPTSRRTSPKLMRRRQYNWT
jgi:hypothetical protein